LLIARSFFVRAAQYGFVPWLSNPRCPIVTQDGQVWRKTGGRITMGELDIYKQQGFGGASGFGERPALVIVDFVNGFTDPDQFGGGNITQAVEKTVPVLAAARQAGLPVVFTRVVYADDGSDAGVFCMKSPNLVRLTETAPAAQVVDQLAPVDGEYVLRKTEPSAFFGTGLAPWLVKRKVDTVLIAGCTTSGCVRASVVDAMSHNFRTIVITDCVGDRAMAPHDANLFDMQQKYADLMDADDVVALLEKQKAA
jgi:maleamate amidohydrolase